MLGLINNASSRSWITFFHASVHFIVVMNTVLRYCSSINVYPRPRCQNNESVCFMCSRRSYSWHFLSTWTLNYVWLSGLRTILLLTENSSHQTENHLMLCSVLLSGSVIVTCFFTYFCRGCGLDRPVRYVFTLHVSTETIFIAGFNTAERETFFCVQQRCRPLYGE